MIDNKIKNTIKYPTSLIINGASELSLEITSSLLEQGGYVILVDAVNEKNFYKIIDSVGENARVSFIDYSDIPYLEQDLRRLDYTFFLQHEVQDPYALVSTQAFLRNANYLDAILATCAKLESKFLLATSLRASYEIMKMGYDKSGSAIKSQPEYQEMDLHKYAESLTLEYVEKAGLAGRVVRVGEIIGDGLDLAKETMFNKLLIQAIRGEKIEVPGDGLDSEYYIHLLDAGYGVIKAQFSKETVGKIYSVSYEVPITNLSIAYRLQELEPNARDIIFSKDLQHGNNMRLQRSATSLTQLGWQPRIDLDQAISESLVAAKAANLDAILEKSDDGEDAGLINKVKSFLSIAQVAETSQGQETEGGPVSRLIAERQQQEEIKNSSVSRADDYLRRRRRARNLTFGERIQNFIWGQFQKVQNSFGFLSETTPTQFFLGIVLIAIGLLFYFGIFSPVVVLTRNIVVAQENMRSVNQAIMEDDFQTLEAAASSLYDITTENDTVLKDLRIFARPIAADSFLNEAIELNDAYIELASGAKDLTYALAPLGQYLDDYVSNVRFRGSAENYLGVGNSFDYGTTLEKIAQRSSFADTGNEKISSGLLKLQQMRENFFVRQLNGFNTNLHEKAQAIQNYSDVAVFLPQLLAVDGESRYLVLLVDNSRPMPLGGELAAVAEIAVNNGAVLSAQVVAANTIELGESNFPSYISSLMTAETEAVSFENMDLVTDNLILADALDSAWQEYYGASLSGVSILTVSGLETLLPSEEKVVVENTEFDAINLLGNLTLLQGDDGPDRRNDLLAQIFAQTLVRKLEDLDGGFNSVMLELAELTTTEDFVIAGVSSDLSKLVAKNQLDGNKSDRVADSDLKVFVTSDPRISDLSRYPVLSQSTAITINDDASLNYETLVRFPSINNIQSLAVCLPVGAVDISVQELSNTSYDIKNIGARRCVNVQSDDITEVGITWRVVGFAEIDGNNYNLKLGLSKPTGVGITSNVEISLAPTLTLQNLEPKVSVVANQFGLTEDLVQDQIINLEITK